MNVTVSKGKQALYYEFHLKLHVTTKTSICKLLFCPLGSLTSYSPCLRNNVWLVAGQRTMWSLQCLWNTINVPENSRPSRQGHTKAVCESGTEVGVYSEISSGAGKCIRKMEKAISTQGRGSSHRHKIVSYFLLYHTMEKFLLIFLMAFVQ